MGIRILVLVSLSLGGLTWFHGGRASLSTMAVDAPEPRAPLIPRITSVDQLVPFAKIIVQRDYIGQRLGWSVRGGERVLYETSSAVHPWVREAFIRALKDLGCSVDVVIRDRGGRQTDWKEVARSTEERLASDLNKKPQKQFGHGGSGPPRPPSRPGLQVTEEMAKHYDVVIGSQGRGSGAEEIIPGLGGADAWVTPELMAAAGAVYPGDLMDLIDAKSWAVLRNAARVEISDLQGSEASFTWFPEWWEIIEGTHPKIKSPADASTFGTLRRGRSEYALFAGHLMAVPREGAIEQTDFKGRLVATIGQEEQGPKITLWHDRGEIVKIEGGGAYGDMWRRVLELTKDIQYPGYPRPGTGWIQEFSVGTNPKIAGPVEVEELKGQPGRDPAQIRWPFARDRAGAVHAGYGSRGASWWARTMDVPVNHYHLRMFFVTYIAHGRDGKTVKLLDYGHLTTLNDPDIRALAATYGNPDKMLSMDWVPILTPDLSLKQPQGRVVSYDQFVASLPFKLNDPRLVYRRPAKLEQFYGDERVKYYNPETFLEFYRQQGQLPVKRVK
ncbi:MAG: hypothetical protein HY652_10220 [Acidobacteria bacterium]|nr:hypothetical protein [Acidobacteriota bacterium]